MFGSESLVFAVKKSANFENAVNINNSIYVSERCDRMVNMTLNFDWEKEFLKNICPNGNGSWSPNPIKNHKMALFYKIWLLTEKPYEALEEAFFYAW